MIRDARARQGLVRALQHQGPDVVEEAAETLSGLRWLSNAVRRGASTVENGKAFLRGALTYLALPCC